MAKSNNFGIIGCGLMGKEFACAASRWNQLDCDISKPNIIGVCDVNEKSREWFSFLNPKYSVGDYRELIDKEDIDAIYCAVPHNMHEKIYTDIIRAGKHLMGEKPFGIDKKANDSILQAINDNPDVIVRCSSEFPFYPGCKQLINWIKEDRFGQIIEVKSGLCHSSDMDLDKPLNWKRMINFNGEYGCMGDLGIHTQHVPFRMGFIPQNVYAYLSNIVTERPDGKGATGKCETWDNALLLCETLGRNGERFPMQFEIKRMMPGATNRWYMEIYGLKCSAKFTTDDPNAFYYTDSWGKEQAWCRVGIGNKPQISNITGSIFEFGFSDSILQMWAAFMAELDGKPVEFGCFTPEESRMSHALHTAALLSNKERRAVPIVV